MAVEVVPQVVWLDLEVLLGEVVVASVVGINVRDGGTGDGGCAIRSGGGGACVRDAKAS